MRKCLKEGEPGFLVFEIRCTERGPSRPGNVYGDDIHITFPSAAGVLDRLERTFERTCGPDSVERVSDGELNVFRCLSEDQPDFYTKFKVKPFPCVNRRRSELFAKDRTGYNRG